jgi:hypothetical protein
MPKAAKKYSAIAPTIDPVVELSKKLLVLWDADDGSEREYSEANEAGHIREDTLHQFRDWRNAVETMISFTPARGIDGALVQLALALDTIDDLPSPSEDDQKKQIDTIQMLLHRLIRSAMDAMDAMHSEIQTEIDPTVRSIIKIYGGNHDIFPKWIDRVNDWASKGQVIRHQEDGG